MLDLIHKVLEKRIDDQYQIEIEKENKTINFS